jgi:cation:H+ antiporter
VVAITDLFLIIIPAALVCVGLVIVALSADQAIEGLLSIAQFLGLSEFTISFVLAGIIAIIPELTIGIIAAASGSSSLGFGVILGANVADLTLVIGVVATYAKEIRLDAATIKNMKLSFLAVVLPVLLFLDGEISRFDAILLIIAFILYVFNLLRLKKDETAYTVQSQKRPALQVVFLAISLAFLFLGGALITNGSEDLSKALGIPLFFIGVIVAVGTCIPEMSFSIRSCNKKHCNLGLGNIIGNVLADSLLTIGIIALIQPIKPLLTLPPLFSGLTMAISGLIVYLLSRNGIMSRRGGLILISIYVIFVAFQFITQA